VALLQALRAGDEAAFLQLVDRYNASMIRIARAFVATRAAAEDVAQDTWLGVVKGVERFEGRSSFKTWLFQLVVNCAQTRGAREGRSVPFSALEAQGDDGPAVDPDRFHDASSRYAGHWASPPKPWADRALIDGETVRLASAEIERLPTAQRAVITMRDVEGLDAREVCDLLGISEGNQRVLLHRARCRVRASLERHLRREERP
jgi:RNA polymerase sigma-70 factor (ECF subfamily)